MTVSELIAELTNLQVVVGDVPVVVNLGKYESANDKSLRTVRATEACKSYHSGKWNEGDCIDPDYWGEPVKIITVTG